ncbi:MAG: hypothetical protein ACPLYW_02435 [Candidatus Nanoarchaeia archaeon]
MATLLDAIGILKQFGVYNTILPFLLITAAVYALLTKYKPFGELKFINGIISIVVGFLVISIMRAVQFINLFIPIFTIFLLLLVLSFLIFSFMGVKTETISEMLTKQPAAAGLFVLIILIIVIVVLTQVFPEPTMIIQYPEQAEALNLSLVGPNATAREQAAAFGMLQVIRIITSPQILSLIILFVIFGITAYFIMREKK